MKEENLTCKVRAKKYKSYRGQEGKIAKNILNRNFKAEKPNEKWATDVTEFALCNEKIYLSPIIDLYNGEIISYKISKRPILKQVLDMVEDATRKIKETKGIILHSDQGWQWYCKQAGNKQMMPHGVDQFQNFTESRNQLLPSKNRYYGFFGKLGREGNTGWKDPNHRNFRFRGI